MLAGTTETPYSGDPSCISITQDEIKQILDIYNHYFPNYTCNHSDIIDTYCGLRVLPENSAAAFAASREALIHCDHDNKPTYIAVHGGKLTTYRKEAEHVLKLIHRNIKAPHQVDTKKIVLKVKTFSQDKHSSADR